MSKRRAVFLRPTLVWSCLAAAMGCGTALLASDTPDPVSVTVAGSLQDELGCPGDWQPDCAATHLAFDLDDQVWQGTFDLPAGDYEYKAALNDSWDENYGQNATRDGANIPLSLGADASVKVYYSHETHWVTDGVNSRIPVAPGSFQSELGCASDWDPSCLRSWLQDPDGDGIFTFRTRRLPMGDYEAKVAIGESWDENYGEGGVPGGANIVFSVPGDCLEMLFSYDDVTHVLMISAAPPPSQPASLTIAGSLQDELGCPGDWQPDCAVTHLAFDSEDAVWQGIFSLPAGEFEYKGALDDSWDVNYGANATLNGPNIPLSLAGTTDVKFYYPHDTHWVTDNQGFVIATAPGSFQSELGCNGDWDPSCLRSWLQDPDGDGIHTFSAPLPAGSYEVKVTINESWDENYGDGGEPGGANIPFTVPAACTEMFFTYDEVSHVLTVTTEPGGPAGNLAQAKAHWLGEDLVAWDAGGPAEVYRLHWAADGGLSIDDTGVVGGDSMELTVDPAGIPADVAAKFPHLAGLTALRLPASELPVVPEILRGQIAVSAAAADATPLDATSLQIPGVLDDLYTYSGPLGPVFAGGVPSLSLWAPTARSVTLELYADSDPATLPELFPMTLDPASGVWSVTGDASWDRDFYRYDVEVFVPTTGAVEHNLVTDPYSLSLSLDSARSQILDLADADLAPTGWATLVKPALEAPEDIVIYELHVRDFSISDTTVPEELRGSFAAFSVPGSDGMSHLSALAEAGLTHIHLLPSFDIATVPENRADQLTVDQDLLASFPPDSEQQQALIAGIKDQDGFNWGYDPWHYTVPEGSYATDPDGEGRVLEFREMVQGLNDAGLRVVMDVVYNHTNAAGQNSKSVLDRIVPGYYHRLSATGAIETSSCCPNTASEHAMMEKLLIDSVLTWAREYKVDGFRFDLMGHHMKSNMLNLRAALDALTLESDGVDGSKIYVYGEGWNFGEVADGARGENAIQANMAGTGIGTFSDRLRDGVRGGNPFSDVREQGFINGLYYDPNGYPQGDELASLLHRSDWIRVGLAGDLADYELVDAAGDLVRADQVDYFGQPAGYTADPQENIKYIAAHDNETLFDTTQLKAPATTSMADRVRIQNLGTSIVALGQGIPFFHAGQDLLRSKSMDRDSFNSGDWFNQLDWTLETTNWGHGLPTEEKNGGVWFLMQPLLADPALAPQQADVVAAADHFREVLAIRKSSPLFRLRTDEEVGTRVAFHNTGPDQIPGLVVMTIADDAGDLDRATERIVTLFNAGIVDIEYTLADLAGSHTELHPILEESADPVVRTAAFDDGTGTFSVPARTTAVFLVERPASEQIELLIGDIDALEADGGLSSQAAEALRRKLEHVVRKLERGLDQAAAGQLGAFLNQVNAFEQRGELAPEDAAALREAGLSALAAIGG